MTHSAHLDLGLLGFLMLGLVGSAAHCVGMCAPFVMVVSRHYAPSTDPRGVLAAQAWYNAGRIITYVLLGALAGGLGHAVDRAGAWMGVQRAAGVVAGMVLVTWALASWLGMGQGAHGVAVFARVARMVKGRIPPHPILVGLFLGLLPCGLLYTAVIAAGPRGPIDGAVALAVFGAGTAPALLGVSLADQLLGRARRVFNRLSQVFVLVIGLWYLWRGLIA